MVVNARTAKIGEHTLMDSLRKEEAKLDLEQENTHGEYRDKQQTYT